MPTTRITQEVINPQKMNVVPIATPAGKKFGRGSRSGGNLSQPGGTFVCVSSLIKLCLWLSDRPRAEYARLRLQIRQEK